MNSMKRSTFARVRLVAAAAMLCAAPASAQITGSAHDFSEAGWARSQICLPCHTPHNAADIEINGYAAGRLWNHALPSPAQFYQMYGGDRSRDEALDTYSLLCMGCHDGTVALDSYGGAQGTVFMGAQRVRPTARLGALLGTDLTDEHPVGADAVWIEPEPGGFNPRSTWENQTFGGSRMGRLRQMIVDGQAQWVVSCATCHEPHRSGGHDDLLRISNVNSQLCLVCHAK